MAGVSLTEQIGAMGLIDELRHRQMVVQEHLDLPERRKEVAGRIREFYQSKNIAVDDELVEQGVRAYFERRLSFEAPALGTINNVLASIYVSRGRWWKPVAGIVAMIIASTMVVDRVYSYLDNQKTEEVRHEIESDAHLSLQIKSNIESQQQQLQLFIQSIGANNYPLVNTTVQKLMRMLANAASLNHLSYPSIITAQSRDADYQAASEMRPSLKQAHDHLTKATAGIATLQNVLKACQALNNLRGDPEYQESKRQHTILAEIERQALSELALDDGPKLIQTINSLQTTTAMTKEIDGIGRALKEVEQTFAAMRLPADEALQIGSMSRTVKEAIEKLDTNAAATSFDNLRHMLTYASTPLTLNIVDRSGTKSGVERNYHASNGKSWYLIVEATDNAGQVVPVPVKSVESGKQAHAELFGVRVSQHEFERVKADKKQDGHVDERLLGTKPVNTLAIQFNSRVGSSKPDTILEW